MSLEQCLQNIMSTTSFFGGDEGYISVYKMVCVGFLVYKMVGPNVRPGVCSAIVGVIQREPEAWPLSKTWDQMATADSGLSTKCMCLEFALISQKWFLIIFEVHKNAKKQPLTTKWHACKGLKAPHFVKEIFRRIYNMLQR